MWGLWLPTGMYEYWLSRPTVCASSEGEEYAYAYARSMHMHMRGVCMCICEEYACAYARSMHMHMRGVCIRSRCPMQVRTCACAHHSQSPTCAHMHMRACVCMCMQTVGEEHTLKMPGIGAFYHLLGSMAEIQLPAFVLINVLQRLYGPDPIDPASKPGMPALLERLKRTTLARVGAFMKVKRALTLP